MYGFPSDLDLTAAIGHETTCFCVGPYDLQFSFGPVSFVVQSRVELHRDGAVIATWQAGEWPAEAFYLVFSVPVTSVRLTDQKCLCIALGGGLELHVLDTSDQYESAQIYVPDAKGPYIV
jgi:hypothetical protein